MNAIVLAAGRGTRLGLGCPKCLAELDGRGTILDHQLASLAAVGVRRITVVTGFCATRLQRAVGRRARCLYNPDFAITNSLHSLWLARDALAGDTFVVNGDVLADPGVYAALARSRGSALAFDSRSGDEPEHMKVTVVDGAVRRIAKTLAPADTHGESLGLFKLDRIGAACLARALEDRVSRGDSRAWAPLALGDILGQHRVRGLDVAPRPWVEVDFPADLERARREVLPAIAPEAGAAAP